MNSLTNSLAHSSTDSSPVNNTLYSSVHHQVEFPNRGLYDVKEITIAEWTAWIDATAQATLKSHTYTLTWTA